MQGKKAVVVTARVHPGETNSSWMMKGLIDLLTSQSPDAEVTPPPSLLSLSLSLSLSLPTLILSSLSSSSRY